VPSGAELPERLFAVLLGWQQIRIEHGAGSFGPNLRFARAQVARWTIDGRVARFTVGTLACG
jgi:hypothetical protein